MIAVITLHTSASNWKATDVHSFSWNVFNFFDSIVRWGVPVFTMISGALFLDNKKELSIKTLYSKNILRLVVAFLFWSFMYALATFIYKGGSILSFLAQVIRGNYHMWFLFMLVGLYIITPLLRKITANRKDTQYFLIISFVFTFLIPVIFLCLKYADTLFGTDGAMYDLANSVYKNVNFHFAIGYSFYFVLGYYLSMSDISKKMERVIYIFGFLGFASTILLTRGLSYYMNSPQGTFYNNLTINVMLESIAVFTLAKCKIAKAVKSERQISFIRKLSKYSFGIYLVHAGFLTVFSKLGLTTLSFNPIFSVIAIVVIAFFLSLLVSAILNKIPFAKKYLV
jgi:Uncharacterized protein conserved in bacteria